jgi:GTP cyclohydrolase I
MVLIRDIALSSPCEHHPLPFVGKAHVGYIPNERVAGLSKLARVMEGYSRRPQLQERLTAQVADALYKELGARGAIVAVEANHLCMTMRGPEARERDRHQRRAGHLRRGRAHPTGGHEPHNRLSLGKL